MPHRLGLAGDRLTRGEQEHCERNQEDSGNRGSAERPPAPPHRFSIHSRLITTRSGGHVIVPVFPDNRAQATTTSTVLSAPDHSVSVRTATAELIGLMSPRSNQWTEGAPWPPWTSPDGSSPS